MPKTSGRRVAPRRQAEKAKQPDNGGTVLIPYEHSPDPRYSTAQWMVRQQLQTVVDAIQSGNADRAAMTARALIRLARLLDIGALLADAARTRARSTSCRADSTVLLERSATLRRKLAPFSA
jgi:hypothetical protein